MLEATPKLVVFLIVVLLVTSWQELSDWDTLAVMAEECAREQTGIEPEAWAALCRCLDVESQCQVYSHRMHSFLAYVHFMLVCASSDMYARECTCAHSQICNESDDNLAMNTLQVHLKCMPNVWIAEGITGSSIGFIWHLLHYEET